MRGDRIAHEEIAENRLYQRDGVVGDAPVTSQSVSKPSEAQGRRHREWFSILRNARTSLGTRLFGRWLDVLFPILDDERPAQVDPGDVSVHGWVRPQRREHHQCFV